MAAVERVDTLAQAALEAAHPLEQAVGLALVAVVVEVRLAGGHPRPVVGAEAA